MVLKAGTKLGPYEVLSPLGAGGMGEVYLASDSKLDRKVAIKVLPESMTRDPERVARFEREAKVLASLNHPNIAAIHGFDDANGTRFLVMEYVEGETLGQQLKGGAFTVEDALDVAKQMAEALEAAHEKGVIHRDLKPGNVMIRPDGTVKVLDFGLAKAMAEEPSDSVPTDSPTITANFTRPGVVLGTAAYMSPEQARGRPLDKRTDIWSFGIMLFECLTGDRLFQGETANDSMGAIMHRDPDWSLLPPNTPPTIQLLLRRCLTKDRKRRLHDIADARVELEAAIVDPTASSLGLASAAISEQDRRASRKGLAIVFPLLSVALAIGLGYSLLALNRAREHVLQDPIYLNVEVSPDAPLSGGAGAQTVLSPDGKRIVCVAGTGQESQLFTRRLDHPALAPVSGTRGARQPFFSPDGQWIGFFVDRKLKRVSVSGGTPSTLCDTLGGGARGATWGDNGMIYFAPNTTTGIWRVSETGGTPEQITKRLEGERSHRWPHVLPGGRALFFTAQKIGTNFNESNIEVLDLATGGRSILNRGGSYPSYLPTGHLVFAREGAMYAMPFDLDSLSVTGTPVPVLEGLKTDHRNGGAKFAFSRSGLLVYHVGGQAEENNTIVWVDRAGKTTPLIEKLGNYNGPRISPDGTKIAMNVWESAASIGNIWIYDIERGTLSRLTFIEGEDFRPTWSPDGTRIYFASTRESSIPNIFVKPSDGSGVAERITNGESARIVSDISSDGGTLLFLHEADDTDDDIMTLDLTGEAEPEIFLQTPFAERTAQFSPDGRWIAYVSNESGNFEVYVRPFGHGGGKWQVSTDGGLQPLWSPDGKELFYQKGAFLMVVAVELDGSSFRAGNPVSLFELDWGRFEFSRSYDIAPDGERFVAVIEESSGEAVDRAHQRFIFNWFDDVATKVPTDGN